MLVIELDAFKPEYLRYTTYLKSLAEDNLHGTLETILGFSGIMATFLTGFYPKEHNVFAIFDCSEDSSLKWVTRWSFLGRTPLTLALNVGRLVKGDRFFSRLPRMPFEHLQYFDIALRKTWPQRGSLDERTLYDYLRENSKTFVSIDWPNVIATDRSSLFLNRSNRGVLQLTKRNKGNYDFCFTHFLALDYVAHEHGTHSAAIRACVEELDQCLAELDSEDMLIFSDHGMVDVQGYINVESEIQRLGLEFGRDLVYFLDSTCVRFWFHSQSAEARVRNALLEIAHGRVLGKEELSIFRLPQTMCDLLFLADPGYVISPNAFQGHGKIKAMHGYDPKHPDQEGFYLVKGAGGNRDAHMVDMLPTMLDLMGLPSIVCDGRSLVADS